MSEKLRVAQMRETIRRYRFALEAIRDWDGDMGAAEWDDKYLERLPVSETSRMEEPSQIATMALAQPHSREGGEGS